MPSLNLIVIIFIYFCSSVDILQIFLECPLFFSILSDAYIRAVSFFNELVLLFFRIHEFFLYAFVLLNHFFHLFVKN